MKFLLGSLLTLFVSCLAYAGGTIGGGGGGLVNEELALSLEALPKFYIEVDDFRRVKARLSVAGTESTPALVDGETVDLKAFRDSVVDVKFSKEVLASPAQ